MTAVEVAWFRDECVHELIEEQVRRNPDAVALIGGDRALTYAELDRRANGLAHRLRALGAGPETVVSICLQRGSTMVIALLAILKAGAAYAPLDPGLPARRLALLAGSVRAIVTVADENTQDLVRHHSPVVHPEAAGEAERPPAPGTVPTNTMYVLHTSGSSGRPKGVQIEHRSVVNRLGWAQARFRLTEDDVVLQKTPYTFDVSVWELFWPLMVGAQLAVAAPDAHRSPAEIAETIERFGVTTAHFVPSMLDQFVSHVPAGRCPSLVRVLASGEALRAGSVRQFTAMSGAELHNLYGPTEAAIDVTHWPCPPDLPAGAVVPIGRAITNIRTAVLGPDLLPVAPGAPGDLYLAGVGLARGYRRDPRNTADAFRPDPDGRRPGDRMYRTGDRARQEPDGTLTFLGRTDDQVKVRGHRVELGEIETLLRAHPAVGAAGVIATPGHDGDTRLAAYLTVQTPVSVPDLRAYLAERLPEPMVPAAIVILPALPLSANGKLDRSALPSADVRSGLPYTEPATVEERALAEIWSEVLGVSPVGSRDDFFALGGHSIAAAQLVTRIRARYDVDLPLRAVFESPTVAELTRVLAAADRTPAAFHVLPTGSNGPFPLSFAQRRLWFLAQLWPGSGDYNVPICRRLTGSLNVEALNDALTTVALRQHALRTVFPAPDGEPAQVVEPPHHVPLTVINAPADPSELAELIAAEVARGIDLERGPIWRVALFRVTDEEHVLVVTVHHIAVDALSVRRLIDEIGWLYSGLQTGADPAMPPLAVQYTDFAVAQRRAMNTSRLRTQREYWKSQLAGVPPVSLPVDRRRPRRTELAGDTYGFTVPAATASRLRSLGGSQGATTNMVLAAAFAMLLSRVSDQTDIALGSPAITRQDDQLTAVIGCFLNTLVLRLDLRGDPTFADLVGHVRETTLSALEHGDVPFEIVVSDVDPARDVSRSPLFNVAFSHQPADDMRPGVFHGLSTAPYWPRQRTAKADLTLALVESGDLLRGFWEFRTSLFDRATVAGLHGRLMHLLEAVGADPQLRVSTVPMSPDADIPAGPPIRADDADRGIHEIIEAQAGRTPDAIAVARGTETITYETLDRRANQLAHELVAVGVSPGTTVDPDNPAGIRAFVMILAILKAGGVHGASHADATTVRPRWERVARRPTRNPGIVRAPSAPAAVSERAPGPVFVGHRDLAEASRWTVTHHGVGAGDRVLGVPYTPEGLWPLAAGATIVLAEESGDAATGAELAGEIAATGATVWEVGPVLLDRLTSAGPSRELLATLRSIRTRADSQSVIRSRRLSVLCAAELHHVYRPAEAAFDVAVWRTDPDQVRSVFAPIGRPVGGTVVEVLDRWLNPVPPGTVGRIHVTGSGVPRLRTADLAVRRRDGTVEHRGRADDVVSIGGDRVHLAEIEAALLACPGVGQACVVARRDGAETVLVAYLTPAPGRPGPNPATLDEHLRGDLPDHSVPTAFVTLDVLPITRDGLVDRPALPAPPEPDVPVPAAMTPLEQTLAQIWTDVLGVARVGRSDNFFQLGGDSIIGMQIIARARKDGIGLAVADLFESPTVAGLAGVARTDQVDAADDPVTGTVELTPIQRAFFEQQDDHPGRRCQVLEVPLEPRTTPDVLRTALRLVADHHAVLRGRFRPEPVSPVNPSGWRFEITTDAPAPPVDVIEVDTEQLYATAVAAAERPLADTPLFRAVLAVRENAPGRLLVLIHHLLVDAVSWNIVLEDLATACRQVAAGVPVRLPAMTTSYQSWSRRLQEYAGSDAVRDATARWLAAEQPARLPVDFMAGDNTYASHRTITATLDEALTAQLVSGVVPRWHGTGVLDVLVTALTLAVTDWTGNRRMSLDVESHGRDTSFGDVDLSRTVGWFTAIYPLLLRRTGDDVGEALPSVRRELRDTLRHGPAYWVARHLADDPDVRRRLAEGGSADLILNYLGAGRFGGRTAAGAPVFFGEGGQRGHLLSIVALVSDGRLRVQWTYSANRHGDGTIRKLADRTVAHIGEFVQQCALAEQAGGTAPARFPSAALGMAELNRTVGGQGIDDVYPLTPLQHGVLFHCLAAPGSGMYVNQLSLEVTGSFDHEHFRDCLQATIDSNQALRSSFRWVQLREPHQLVHTAAPLPYRMVKAEPGTTSQLSDLSAEDRADFDLTRPPLIRLTTLRHGPLRHDLLLTTHHVILDGWSGSLLLDECWARYLAGRAGSFENAPRPPFRTYVDWLGRQNPQAAKQHWAEVLGGFAGPSLLGGTDRAAQIADGQHRVIRERLPHRTAQELKEFCRTQQLTVSTVIYGAWGIVLSRVLRSEDVVFGVTVSGRAAPLPELDRMIGLFVNTLPVRARSLAGEPAVAYLRRMHDQVTGVTRYGHTSPADARSVTAVARHLPLFDTAVMVQNFPVYLGNDDADGSLTVRRGPSGGRTSYPLLVEALPTEPMTIRIQFEPSVIAASSASRFLDELCTTIDWLLHQDAVIGEPAPRRAPQW